MLLEDDTNQITWYKMKIHEWKKLDILKQVDSTQMSIFGVTAAHPFFAVMSANYFNGLLI